MFLNNSLMVSALCGCIWSTTELLSAAKLLTTAELLAAAELLSTTKLSK